MLLSTNNVTIYILYIFIKWKARKGYLVADGSRICLNLFCYYVETSMQLFFGSIISLQLFLGLISPLFKAKCFEGYNIFTIQMKLAFFCILHPKPKHREQ